MFGTRFDLGITGSNFYILFPRFQIFHPNVNKKGEISIDILGSQWSPSLRIDLVLLSICSVLSNPVEPFVPGNPAVMLYQQDRNAYEKIARMWTLEFANA